MPFKLNQDRRRHIPRQTHKVTNWREGSVAKIAVGCEWPRQTASQAAIWNNSAMKLACARMSRPPTFQTCPFLIIAIAS